MLIVPNPNPTRLFKICEYVDHRTGSAGTASQSYSGVNFGRPHAQRRLLLATSLRRAMPGAINFTGVTIGGVSATAVGTHPGADSSRSRIGFFIADVPTGESGTVTINTDQTTIGLGFTLFRIVGLQSATPTDQWTSTLATVAEDIDIASGGFAIGASVVNSSNAVPTWTGVEQHWFNAGVPGTTVANSSMLINAWSTVEDRPVGLTWTASPSVLLTSIIALR